MNCSKCEEHKWDDHQPSIIVIDGKDYCLFHAQVKHKGGITVDDFNSKIFALVNNSKTNIGHVCNLSGIIFPGDISFTSYSHEDKLPAISFAGAEFFGNVDFNETNFVATANFERSLFRGKVDFTGAIFDYAVNFRMAKFEKYACFMQMHVAGVAEFENAIFESDVSFGQAHFSKIANFSRATFKDAADYWSSRFYGQTVFHRATFENEANFQDSIFEGETSFVNVRANKNAVRLHSLTTTSLSNIFFSSLDTECISFKGCTWPDRLGCEARAYNVTDREETPLTSALISEEIYRSLKQKAASEHDQPMTSWWHYREKLMKLEGVKLRYPNIWHFHWLGIYWRLCGFGERWVPPLKTLGVMLLICLLLLGLGGVHGGGYVIQGPAMPTWGNVQNLGAVCLSLLKYILLLKDESIEFRPTHGAAEFTILLFTRLVIPIQTAFFAIALRNAYRR